MNPARQPMKLGLAIAAGLATTAAAHAEPYQWTTSSGLRPDQVGAMARVATGIEPSDTLTPGGPLRLHTGDIEHVDVLHGHRPPAPHAAATRVVV